MILSKKKKKTKMLMEFNILSLSIKDEREMINFSKQEACFVQFPDITISLSIKCQEFTLFIKIKCIESKCRCYLISTR